MIKKSTALNLKEFVKVYQDTSVSLNDYDAIFIVMNDLMNSNQYEWEQFTASELFDQGYTTDELLTDIHPWHDWLWIKLYANRYESFWSESYDKDKEREELTDIFYNVVKEFMELEGVANQYDWLFDEQEEIMRFINADS